MNKILVSGLALGMDPELNTCQSCNYDLSWLFNNPSTLLWADKILVTPEILSSIKNSKYPGGNEDLGRAINLIFEGLEKNGLLEIKKASDIITKEIKDELYSQIEKDKIELALQFSKDVSIGSDSNVPGQVFVSEAEYCTPSLWTNYASLMLAKEWNSNLFFTKYAQSYFDKLFLLKSKQFNPLNEKAEAFENIFTSKLPEYELLPIILFAPNSCDSCKSLEKCSTDVFSKVEENLNRALEWRNYDEIYHLKSVLEKITKETSSIDINAKELIRAYKEEETRVRQQMNSIFPKVERWSNMITMLSIPVVVAGVSSSSMTISSLGAGTAGIGTALTKYLDVLKSKNRWVGHKILK